MRPPLVIKVPGTIPYSLTANGRRSTHWRTIHRDAEDLKTRTHYAALEAIGDPNDPYLCFQHDPWPLAITYVVGWEKRRHLMDDDNVIAAMKNVRDTIASVLGVDDKHFLTNGLMQERDPEGKGYIGITIISSAAYVQVPRDWYERAVDAIGDVA
ncbi:MAG TPA: hypothetical protein VFQ54_11020 [Thermomicrobiales bacterium]|nr:hypothetical protein [Thermomicrobiales bacterium]